MEISPHGDPTRGEEGRGCGGKNQGQEPRCGGGGSESKGTVLLLFRPATNRRGQSAGLPSPQAPAVPVPIDPVGSSVSVPRMVLPQGRGVNPASPGRAQGRNWVLLVDWAPRASFLALVLLSLPLPSPLGLIACLSWFLSGSSLCSPPGSFSFLTGVSD